jgi:SAM-dependent methyltransferase
MSKSAPKKAKPAAAAVPVAPAADPLAKYARLEAFCKKLWSDVYPETPTNLHADITARVWARVKETWPIAPGAKVLDIGCGQGVALKHFAADRLDAIGIAIGEDVNICRAQGFNAVEMDLTFLEFPDETFDLVWCRHVLEHSIMPFFTLAEIFRVLKPGGVVYIEVPCPDTVAGHELNKNHYSVFGLRMLRDLIERSGFVDISHFDIGFQLKMGPDKYWGFIQRKPAG